MWKAFFNKVMINVYITHRKKHGHKWTKRYSHHFMILSMEQIDKATNPCQRHKSFMIKPILYSMYKKLGSIKFRLSCSIIIHLFYSLFYSKLQQTHQQKNKIKQNFAYMDNRYGINKGYNNSVHCFHFQCVWCFFPLLFGFDKMK